MLRTDDRSAGITGRLTNRTRLAGTLDHCIAVHCINVRHCILLSVFRLAQIPVDAGAPRSNTIFSYVTNTARYVAALPPSPDALVISCEIVVAGIHDALGPPIASMHIYVERLSWV